MNRPAEAAGTPVASPLAGGDGTGSKGIHSSIIEISEKISQEIQKARGPFPIRKICRLLGLKYYTWRGVPCARGHLAKRRASDGSCVVCAMDDNRAWRKKNPALRQAQQQRYQSGMDRDQKCAYWNNRRSRKLGNGGEYTAKDIAGLRKSQNGKCYWCKVKLGDDFHVDHVWPLSKSGSNGPENLVLACPPCNLKKHAKTPMEFAGRLL